MKHKYQIVWESIEEKIQSGVYQEKLPTEDSLIQEYDVSRNTIRKALEVLIQKGYIIPIQGSGFFIRRVSIDGAINLETFRGLSRDFKNSNIETHIIEFEEKTADEEIARGLKCEVGTPIYYICRLRIVDGMKWVIEYSYYNRKHVPYLNLEIIKNSIYNYIREGLNKQIGYVDRILETRLLTQEEADILDLTPAEPALLSVNRSMFKTGEIFDYSIDVHHYKHARFLKLSNISE